MDADGRIIPLVEDDQGEGIKDFIDGIKDSIDDLHATDERNPFMTEAKEPFVKKKPVEQKLNHEMLESIDNKLDRLLEVFGDHRLINGKWVDISKMES